MIFVFLCLTWGFSGGSELKYLPTMQQMLKMRVWSLGWHNALKGDTNSNNLDCKITWTEESGGQRVRHDWNNWAHAHSLTYFTQYDDLFKPSCEGGIVYVLVTQSYPTLCNPMDCSLPGSSVHGILQARILEWVPIPFSRGDLPDPGIEHGSPTLQAYAVPSGPPGKPLLSQFYRFGHSVNLLSTYSMPGTVLGTGYSPLNTTSIVPLMNLTF